MNHVSRPLLGLLVATVVFFALWIVALKPSSSSPSASSGVGQYQPDINAAKAAVATESHSNAAAGGSTGTPAATTPAAAQPAAAQPAAAKPAAAKPATTAAAAKPAATAVAKPAAARHHAAVRAHAKASPAVATPRQRRKAVDRALAAHRVLALLFYDPAASDDQAVKHELRAIPARHGRVVKLAIPLSELASYPVVTNQVLIQTSPSLVIIDRSAQAFTLVGFVDGLEIAQRVDDALRMR